MNYASIKYVGMAVLMVVCCTKKAEPIQTSSAVEDPYTLSIRGLQVRYHGVTAELLGPKEPWLKMFGVSSLDESKKLWSEFGISLFEETDEEENRKGVIYGITVQLESRNQSDNASLFPDHLELDGVWIHSELEWKNVKPKRTDGFKNVDPETDLYPSKRERFMARWWMPPQDGQCRPVDYILYTNGRDKILQFGAYVTDPEECPEKAKEILAEERDLLGDQILLQMVHNVEKSPALQHKIDQLEQEMEGMKRTEREQKLLEILREIKESSQPSAHATKELEK